MNNICIRRYNVDDNLFKHLEIDLDFSCDNQGILDKSIIYILSDMFTSDEKILYVGQTNVNPKTRIKTHLGNLKFSHIYIMQLNTNDREIVNKKEQEQIKKLNPVLQHFFTDFEKRNPEHVAVPYDYIVKWSIEKDKPRRPGRPRTKEESKPINVNIPVRVLDSLDNLFAQNKEIQLNKTQLITSLLEKYIEENSK